MRVLLLHPDDCLDPDTSLSRESAREPGWANESWDFVMDLGWSGRNRYAEWSERLKCPVQSYINFGEWTADTLSIGKCRAQCNGILIDSEGVDWWDLLAPLKNPALLEFVLLRRIAARIGHPAEIRVTRPHPLADLLAELAGVQIQPYVVKSARSARFPKAKILQTLTPTQIARIALDKWDTDYSFRRLIARRSRSPKSMGCVLLASAYRNASRALLAYASLLPDREFLLVTTRADGRVQIRPSNVRTSSLAAYAPIPRNAATEREIRSLTDGWHTLKQKLQRSEDPLLVYAAGLFPDFERDLRCGLRVRDAWRSVFEREPIEAVFSADENNPYTRLPALLAKKRGLQTVYGGHGALDTSILIRGVCADVYLAKGEMDKDYLVNQCGVPAERVVLGAPPSSHPVQHSATVAHEPDNSASTMTDIFFFSEPYELYSGRTELFYRELLPNLCALARKHNRKVVLKLHPFESKKERMRLVDRALAASERALVQISDEPMSEQLLRRIWFGLTVESSTAVDCALAGIPSFLCGWFDLDLYAYGRQYEKFGAAIVLNRPSDVLRIPTLLAEPPRADAVQRISHPMKAEELAAILEPRRHSDAVART